MSVLSGVNWYVSANILLILAGVIVAGMRAISATLPHPIAYRHQLHCGHAVAAAAVLLPVLSLMSGHGHRLPRIVQIWSAPAMPDGAMVMLENHRIAASFVPSGASMSLGSASQTALVLVVAGFLFLLGRVVIDAWATMRIISDAESIRRHGRVRLLASERIRAPFSFWLPARYFIVVPSALVLHLDDLKMAIRHEAQHHRQLDTKCLYLYQLLKGLFFWNPAVHRLERTLRELQEFACDEALSSRRNISAQEYCCCLLRIAAIATGQSQRSVQAGLIGSSSGSTLKRRIEALLRRRPKHLCRSAVAIAGAVALALMGATALAFTSAIQDQRISVRDADQMAAVARQDSTFPIVVNARVLAQLNLLLATPDGRANIKASLERMQNRRAFISKQIMQHGMPIELLAVPLVESGYRNLPQAANPQQGAGLWMFIAPTARRFGLNVGSSQDERLDVPAETGAAMRLFTSLRLQFNDWGLALLGYNAGSIWVEQAIRETGSHDVWEIIGKGYQNDPDYLPRVMAAILIIKNPTVLD